MHFVLLGDFSAFTPSSALPIIESVKRLGPLARVLELQLDFPARPPKRVPPEERPADLVEALGATPIAVWAARDLMVVFDTEAEVRALQPDMAAITMASEAAR